jgi:hypothetical protein
VKYCQNFRLRFSNSNVIRGGRVAASTTRNIARTVMYAPRAEKGKGIGPYASVRNNQERTNIASYSR